MPSDSVGPYQIVRKLGAGGMGEVYLAEDTRLGRQVALKRLTAVPSDDARRRLLREARAAAALNHPNVAAVYDVIEHGDTAHIVMEYVEGETLAAALRGGPLPLDRVLDIGIQLSSALAAAHARGIVHRDLKPANISVCPDGRVKVLDFGVAKHVIATHASTLPDASGSGWAFAGTPAYASPEQMHGEPVDHRSDIYSAGVVLRELATGQRSVRAHGPVSPVPPPIAAVLDKATAAHPADRYASAGELQHALERVRDSELTTAHVPVSSQRRLPWIVAGVMTAVAVAGVAVSSWLPFRWTAEKTEPVVAVLPFTNLSGDAANDYLGAGIAESLTTSLAALPTVTVASRAATRDALQRSREARRLARDLAASYVVDGGVQQVGDRLRITLTVLRPDASVVWGDTFEGARADIFDMQANIATALIRALEVTVSDSDAGVREARPTNDPEALDHYWRGRALLERKDISGNAEAAIVAFQKALERDARFALAYASLGEAYWAMYMQTRQPEWTDRAIEAGTQALRLDPARPEVRYALAVTYAGIGKRAEALDELRAALARRPRYDDARQLLGTVLAGAGKIEEAVTEFRRAIAQRPNYWLHHSRMGLALYQAGRYDAAAAAFARAIELQPDNASLHQQLGATYHSIGRIDEALESYRRANALQPLASTLTNIGMLHHERGDYQAAVAAYEDAIELRPRYVMAWRNLGDAWRRAGDATRARSAYRRAMDLVQDELKVNPRDGGNMAMLAVYQAKLGEHSAAVTTADRAVALAPADPLVRYRQAVAYTLCGRNEAAVEHLSEAVRLGFSRSVIAEDEDLAPILNVPSVKTLLAR